MIRVECGSAITVLNAIATGIGSTIGIQMENEVTVDNSTDLEIEVHPLGVDDTLVRNCITTFEEATGEQVKNIKITTKTELPHARGLKTSSVVSTLSILALAKYYNQEIKEFQAMQLGGQASINSGVSITGALDDAFTSLLGGFVITENLTKKIVHMSKLPPSIKDQCVMLLIPKDQNPKNKIAKISDKVDTQILQKAKEFAYMMNINEAIRYNTDAYAPHYLRKPGIIEELRKETKSIVGLNGAGPSLFLINKAELSEEIENIINNQFQEYQWVKTKFQELTNQ